MNTLFEVLAWITVVGWAYIIWVVLGRLADRFGTTRFRLVGMVFLIATIVDALNDRSERD